VGPLDLEPIGQRGSYRCGSVSELLALLLGEVPVKYRARSDACSPHALKHLGEISPPLAEHQTVGRAFLHDSLRLLADAQRAYACSNDPDRRLANQAFYTRMDITEDEELRPRLAEPFR
jgi:hypothetical protein